LGLVEPRWLARKIAQSRDRFRRVPAISSIEG
jgi:hypothetical protein